MTRSVITGIITLCMLSMLTTYGQNIQTEKHEVKFYSYPLKPLDKSYKTYSTSLQASGFDLSTRQKDDLVQKGLALPGYERTSANGDVQIELVLSPLKITSKELKDSPSTVETNGQKVVSHNYTYEVSYVCPAKVRIVAAGQPLGEHELPSHFKETFFPVAPAATSAALAEAYGSGER